MPTKGSVLPAGTQDDFAVRFHLHPSIKANRLTDGHGVMLMLPNREVWTFDAHEDRVELEESVFLAGPGRPAPHRADRDPRPCAPGAARALDDFERQRDAGRGAARAADGADITLG